MKNDKGAKVEKEHNTEWLGHEEEEIFRTELSTSKFQEFFNFKACLLLY